MNYPINTLYPTIQGEGVNTGVPMILVRLQGCGVDCPWCDTPETWVLDESQRVETLAAAIAAGHATPAWCWAAAEEIATAAADLARGEQWVLLTGGEPGNYDLHELFAALHERGFRVAVETSGTTHIAQPDWLTVSPKIGMPGGREVYLSTISQADEVKYVIGKPADIQRLRDLLTTLTAAYSQAAPVVCVQPVSLSPKATSLCLAATREYGWRLSIQVHKLIEQP